MTILMLHPHDIYSSREPWTRRIKSIAKELAKRKHEVKLVYFPLSISDTKLCFDDSYQVIPLCRDSSPPVFIKNVIKILSLARQADLIHFQKCHYYAAIPAVIAAYLTNKPLHYDWDDWEEMIWYESCGRGIHSRFIGFSFKILERFLPLLADSVSVSSQYLEELALQFGVKKESIFSIPVGADLEEFNPNIDGSFLRQKYNIKTPLVLYIGQLHGAQYLDLFIQAAKKVLAVNPEVTFVVVGEGFMEKSLKDLVRELKIEDRVIFTGAFTHQKIPECIAAADICVAPFKKTKVTVCKSPLKVVEYMAMGKAIVASNVGEVERMLAGVGILAEPGSPSSLADGILRLLKDKPLRDELGKLARQRAEKKYNWPGIAGSLLLGYEKLYARRRF